MAAAVGLIQVLILWIFEFHIITLFTNDELIILKMDSCWNTFNSFVFFNTLQMVGGTAIKAAGLQKYGAYI